MAEEITFCPCSEISFSQKENQALARLYKGCLCANCLVEMRENFDKPARIYISFQDAQYEDDLCILSREDTTINSHGNKIELFEGKQVDVYEYDEDVNNVRNDIVASGTVEKNLSDFKTSANYKWSIRLNKNGMQFESKLQLIDLLKTWKGFAENHAHTEKYIYEWQNDMDSRRLIDELIEKFPYLKSDNYTYITELEETDKIVLEKTFEINECIWKSDQYNPKKHWYYYRINQLVFDNEIGEFTKKTMESPNNLHLTGKFLRLAIIALEAQIKTMQDLLNNPNATDEQLAEIDYGNDKNILEIILLDWKKIDN
jgi:Cysteine-rich CWC